MKPGLIVFLLAVIVACYVGLFVALRDETPLGKCIGLNGEKQPGLKYSYDVRNIVIGAAAFQSVVLPVYVVLERLECPTAKVNP